MFVPLKIVEAGIPWQFRSVHIIIPLIPLSDAALVTRKIRRTLIIESIFGFGPCRGLNCGGYEIPAGQDIYISGGYPPPRAVTAPRATAIGRGYETKKI